MSSELLKFIANVRNLWALSAFAIAAIVLVIGGHVSKANPGARKTLFALALVAALVALVPISLTTWLEHSRDENRTIYRVRVIVTDESGVPVESATLKSSAPGQTSTSSDGVAELAIPANTVPRDGKLTVWASKDTSFLYGTANLKLDIDHNPSLVIALRHDTKAQILGRVQDSKGRSISGASVRIIGYGNEATITDETGGFQLPAHAGRGEIVRIQVEKKGYKDVLQDHPAGGGVAVVVLNTQH